MNKGLIYITIDWVIEKLNFLNLVELFKFIALKINDNNKITTIRLAVDIFIILKWVLIISLWFFNVKNEFINILVWYLIFTNVYTYFYHHSWDKDLSETDFDLDRIKRRFLNLLLSIAFNVVSFAYLFAQPFANNFKWKNDYSTLSESLSLSAANSLATSYDSVKSVSDCGNNLLLIQIIISFVFFTIILSNSIPQPKTD